MNSTPNIAAASSELGKLTVPQLKALCKERKITGYSKLGKAALLEKLQASNPGNKSDNAQHGIVAPPLSRQSLQESRQGAGHEISRKSGHDKNDKPHAALSTKHKWNNKEPKTTAAGAFDAGTQPVPFAPANLGPRALGHTLASTALEFAQSSLRQQHSTSAEKETLGKPMLAHKRASHVGPAATQSSNLPPGDRLASMSSDIDAVDNLGQTKQPDLSPDCALAKAPCSASGSSIMASAKRSSGDSSFVSKKRRIQDSDSQYVVSVYATGSSCKLAARAALIPASHVSTSSAIHRGSQVQTPGVQTLDPATRQSAKQPVAASRRFRKLIVNQRPERRNGPDNSSAVPTIHSHSTQENTVIADLQSRKEKRECLSIHYLDYPSAPTPPQLTSIALPPSLSQRKRVQCWAIILSELSYEERRQCVLVSRMIRYAVYLSAAHILNRYYKGKRLTDDVLRQYSPAMTNMWPYLLLREAEVARRLHKYDESFIASFLKSRNMPHPIAARLWGSPDNERQIVIALRFVMSRLWLAFSVGVGRTDAEVAPWLGDVVVDVQEVIKGQIWSITVAFASTANDLDKEIFYVLEATCEVIGRQASSIPDHDETRELSTKLPLRTDWSAYISHYRSSSSETSSAQLLHTLKWANHEEYERGISRLWLKRIKAENALGVAKRVVAERYVLACVVANSISGQWMTATEMAQDFAGLSARMKALSRPKAPTVNLYLPEHHHVESVHFTGSSGTLLHPAVAIVQTVHRAYYILRDNGMQVGCEEDGVGQVWQEVMGCNALGYTNLN